MQLSLGKDQRSTYFSIPANQRFHINIEAHEPISVYLKKGQSDIASLFDFDLCLKKERKINLNSETFDILSSGAILTIESESGLLDDLTVTYNTTSTNKLQSFSAAPMPAIPAPPMPAYRGPDDEDYDNPNDFVSNS